ncbi:MAG UNVERIFIED_CONTAM: hypothetical protein LVR18_38035 [Planctomycetaceae bacterium]
MRRKLIRDVPRGTSPMALAFSQSLQNSDKTRGDVNHPVTARNLRRDASDPEAHPVVTGRLTSTARLACSGRGV